METMPVVAEKRVDGSERSATVKKVLTIYARLAIAAGFLSSVADRFGLWGPARSAKVAWGDWKSFVAYTAGLDFFFPHRRAPVLSGGVAVAGTTLGIFVVLGVWERGAAGAGGVLLCLFWPGGNVGVRGKI